jgi:U3 small nucleolar RNA-associated protein 4
VASDTVFSSGIDRKVVQCRLVDKPQSTTDHNMQLNIKKKYKPSLLKPISCSKASSVWIVSGEKRFHSHDVRALALFDRKPIDTLVSGGVDTALNILSSINTFPMSSLIRQSVFPQRPLISMSYRNNGVHETCNRRPTLLSQFDDHVQLWGIDRADSQNIDELKRGTRLDVMGKGGFKIADINIDVRLYIFSSLIFKSNNVIFYLWIRA